MAHSTFREDPVHKYIPEFKPRLDGFDSNKPVTPNDRAVITIAQLASHMSGLGRDWPSGTVRDWPNSFQGSGPPPYNGLPFPSHESLLKAIKETRLVSPPQAYPAYSNTGTGALGLAVVAANRLANGENEPNLYADLVERDIFKPLLMNDSHHLATKENKGMVVVPSYLPEIAVSFIISRESLVVFYTLLLTGSRPLGCHESGSWAILFAL
jgi:CubicO group peptidase (beta-lactamase class C family)